MINILIISLALILQAILVMTISHTYLIESIICISTVMILFVCSVKMNPKIISKYIFNYFWATFIFGGIGMFIGHYIDMHYTSMGPMSHDMIGMNWMTALMLLFCIPVCFFSINIPFKNKPLHYKLHTSLAHILPLIFMMFGMYIGHIISMLLRLNMLYSYYLIVFAMSMLHVIGYELIHLIYSRNVFTSEGIVK